VLQGPPRAALSHGRGASALVHELCIIETMPLPDSGIFHGLAC
jgi:hypothetical protein